MSEELERRVRTVEEELNGEKHLTRYAVDQTRRNGDVLHAVRSEVSAAILRIDHLTGDMAAANSALVMHGRALDVLQQDVRQLRRGQEEIHARLDTVEETMNARFDAVNARFDAMNNRFDAVMDATNTWFDAMNARFDAVMEAIRGLEPRA